MSKRHLGSLTPEQRTMMDHICHFTCQLTNIIVREIRDNAFYPLLTSDEIEALKCFLADYRKQFELTRNTNHND